MPVKLRLRRQGRKQNAHYAIVAADSRSPRDGRSIEKIGTYNPVANPAQVYVDHDAAIRWLENGAQPTNTVRSLLRHAGVTIKFALKKQGKSEAEAEAIFGRWRADKDAKKKKKIVSVDVHGRLLEPVPDQPKRLVVKPAAPVVAEEVAPAAAPVVAEETVAEAAPAVEAVVVAVEETVAEAAPVVEEAVAAVEETVAEAAPAVEEVAAKVEETAAEVAPAVDEAPAPAEVAPEEKPAAE